MLRHAFKEWAVICRALAVGKQAIILRKGGIAEVGNVFRPEHTRFWLYPTWVHQQEQGVQPAGQHLLVEIAQDRPPGGTVRLTHFVEVPGVYEVGSEEAAVQLAGLHFWTEETVRHRFHYRQPGLYVLPARVYQIPQPHELQETPAYAGCKSWVELEQALDTQGAVPVLGEEQFQQVLRTLEAILNPIAFA